MNSGLIKVNELNIGDYMSRNPITVQSDLRVRDAVVIMIDNGIGNLIVTKNKRPIGILTEREVLRFLASISFNPFPRYVKVSQLLMQPK